jgi:Holliday junction resolvase RusA-like endonuclease
MQYFFELKGEIPSKKNTLRFAKGRVFNSKSEEMASLVLQLKIQKNKKATRKYFPLNKDIAIAVILVGDNRHDFNNQITTLCDILQDAEIIQNDRQIKKIFAEKFIKKPKEEPHTTIFLYNCKANDHKLKFK